MSGVVRTQLSDNYHHALCLMSALTRSASAFVYVNKLLPSIFSCCRERDTSENQVTRQEDKVITNKNSNEKDSDQRLLDILFTSR